MSTQAAAARTPGAKRAGPANTCSISPRSTTSRAVPDYSSRRGRLRRGRPHDRRAHAHAGRHRRRPHSHPNEQWIYILEGTFQAKIGDQEIEAKAGSVVYVPSNVVHSANATADADVVFFTVKDASHGLHGTKAGIARRSPPALEPGHARVMKGRSR